jgi:hypothetical protein
VSEPRPARNDVASHVCLDFKVGKLGIGAKFCGNAMFRIMQILSEATFVERGEKTK